MIIRIIKRTVRPSANNVVTTWAISFFSHKSTVWKTSTSSTPYSFNAFWNLQHVQCSYRKIHNWYKCHYSQIDILHHLELSAGSIDLWYGSSRNFVHHMAQDLTILEHFFEGLTRRKLLANDRFDPFLCFPLLLGVAFPRNLCKMMPKS